MAKRIEAFYGQSGTGKSEAAASIIEQIFVQDGLRSRVIVGDGSKATYIDRGLVDENDPSKGIVEVMDFSMRDWPLSTAAKLTEGYWPADVNDPKSPLIAPKREDLARLGVFVVEGLAVMGNYIMGDMKGGLAEQSGRGVKIGENSPVKSKDILYDDKGNEVKNSGPGDVFGGNPMSHFGFAQRRLLANVERTKNFPNIVIWTSHEMGATDKVSGEKLIGMEAVGQAITANLSRVFNNTLHFATAQSSKAKLKDEQTDAMVKDLDSEFRIYTRDHYHPDGTMFVKYKAITRGGIPAKDKDTPNGMPLYLTSDIPGRSILEFYQILANHRQSRGNVLQERRAAAVEKKEAA